MIAKTIFVTLTLGFSSALCLAERGADLKPAMVKAGKVLVEENFSGSALGKSWTVAKGDWKVSDGVVAGREKKEDMHPAVLSLDHPGHDSIIRYSFKLDGAQGFTLSYNSAKGGHLFRILVANDGLTVNRDKDKKDPKSKAALMGKGAGKFEEGKWYTMLVEIHGPDVVIQVDNGIKLTAHNPEIDVDKTGYRFVTKAGPVLLGDLKVWEVAP